MGAARINWEAISSIAEVTGAAAVIISLVYLAVQIRSGTQALKTSTRDASFHHIMEWNYALSQSSDLPALFHRGCEDFSALGSKMRTARQLD